MVVACLALTVALAGTSYAAVRLPANSVGTVQLKRAAVTGAKVKKNTLTGTQIRESTLTIVPAALNADSADSADSAAVARFDYQSAAVSVPGGTATATRGTATCPSGLFATGGGAKMADPNNGFIGDTNPVGRTGWEATGFSAPGVTQNMTVYVICAPAASTTP
ncbi:MAG TPA: hypothetical protein VFT86_02650 [Gaiellaceae bacterium]|nr:hypothetical protein [Gaiellaceae bacterium]